METMAPSGYVTPTGDAAKTATVEVLAGQSEAQNLTVSMTNQEETKGSLKLTKEGKDSEKLAGAEFTLYKDGAVLKEKLTTDDNGEISLSGLEPGKYYFEETKAPSGYVTPTGNAAKTATVEVLAGQSEEQNLTVSMTNTEETKGSLKLTKEGEDSSKLSGAVFTLYKDGEVLEENLITDKNGEISLSGLEPGEYYFVETEAPSGYVTPTGDAAKTDTVEVLPGKSDAQNLTVSMTNTKEAKGSIRLTKQSTGGKVLSGAEFTLYKDGKVLEEKLTTNENGEIVKSGLEPGEYYFVETKAPTGYVTPTGDAAKTRTVIVLAGQLSLTEIPLSVTNTEEAKGRIILTKTGEDTSVLSGAVFTLYRNGKVRTEKLTTDAEGRIVVENLEPGDYYFVETQAPQGYVTPQGDAAKTETVTVAAGKSSLPDLAISMTNTEEAKGKLTLTKKGPDGNALAGALFDLYWNDAVLKTGLTTDANGQIVEENLEPGDYYFVETKAPDGYVTPEGDAAKTETRTVEPGLSTVPELEVSMDNEEARGKITIQKTFTGVIPDRDILETLRFTIEGKDIGGEGVNSVALTIRDFTEKDGVYSYTVDDLPWGEVYTVTEINAKWLSGEVYLVESDSVTTGSARSIEEGQTVELVNHYEEAEQPIFEKKIDDLNDSDTSEDAEEWQDSADYDIGDSVPYRIQATLASNVSSYHQYHVTFVDTMEEGLTNNMDYRVTVNGHEFTDFTVEDEDDHTFTLTFTWGDGTELLSEDLDSAQIQIFYSATLNEDAVIGQEGNVNQAQMKYSCNPALVDDGEGGEAPSDDEDETEWDSVIAYTYRVEIHKVNEKGSPLSGAEFKLEKKLADGSRVEIQKDAGASTASTFVFIGLDAGRYVLTETKAPNRYEQILPVEFTVSATHGVEWDGDELTRGDVLESFSGERNSGAISLSAVLSDGTVSGTVENQRIQAPEDSNGEGYYDYKFSFRKVWQGGHEASIEWTLYDSNGNVVHKRFNKRVVSENEWEYTAWFESDLGYYVVEDVPDGYTVHYENTGANAGETEACYNGGTIVNHKVPKTGDSANPILWLGCMLLGMVMFTAVIWNEKARKKLI
ncbi:MAG: isopeptide-forming domain-containing fimbrial protein [Clostridia bacterium]|nr:isopeptide-forming domain-containing fimbrial protein [Clostridia bacterium]